MKRCPRRYAKKLEEDIYGLENFNSPLYSGKGDYGIVREPCVCHLQISILKLIDHLHSNTTYINDEDGLDRDDEREYSTGYSPQTKFSFNGMGKHGEEATCLGDQQTNSSNNHNTRL